MNWDISSEKQIFSVGHSPKKIFRQKYINNMSTDVVFDGDYEFAIIFTENIYLKNENRKIRVYFCSIFVMHIIL
jgi:hypothetical protein